MAQAASPRAAEAQGRGAMGVSVTVVPFASTATISGATFSAQRRSGSTFVDLQSRVSIRSQTAYSLRFRAEGDGASILGDGVLVKADGGRFQRVATGASPILATAPGSSDTRALDLVLRVDSTRNTGSVVAELIAARLDQ